MMPDWRGNPPAYHTVYPATVLRPSSDITQPATLTLPRDNETQEERAQEIRDWGDRKESVVGKVNPQERLLEQATGFTQRARAALREFCQNTTAHGFSHVVEVNVHVVLRLFWAVVTLVSLAVLLYLSYQVTYSAFVTKRPFTEVTYLDNRSSGLPFPEMTICSLSGFWKSKLKAHQVDSSLASYLLVAVGGPDVASPSLKTDPRRLKILQGNLKTYMTERNLTLSQMITLLSPTCEDIILGCFTDTDKFYSTECCQKLFTPSLTTMGLCYTTVGHNNTKHTQTIAGLIGGQRIVFGINLSEYMEYDTNVVSTTTLAEAGVHVSLSNFDLIPTVAANMHAIRIAPNTAASVALTTTKIDHTERYLEDWPWTSQRPTCVREGPYRAMTEEQQAYTQNNLYFTLLYRYCLLQLANCSAVALRFTNDTTRECLPHQILHHMSANGGAHECLRQQLESYSDRVRKLCHTTSINKQLSYTNLMTETLRDLHRLTTINRTLSMINIYYSHLGYTEYNERIPTFTTWFSNLGGQMGLFLGASFITLVELCFAVFYVVRVVVCRGVTAAYLKLKGLLRATQKQDNIPP
ncbi:acid-sensing ion channel 2-like isoform X2 [Panulirus ornatus]|uniref:acid-sensing ion channel 2-like isoform X2 n=1 Tax=Panulirus ornatus TaxID=150431 RepID=UPI003A85B181